MFQLLIFDFFTWTDSSGISLQSKQQIELQIEMQKLETERLEVAGKLEEQKLRYLAETDRTQSDNAIAHADNLVKILTHTPKG